MSHDLKYQQHIIKEPWFTLSPNHVDAHKRLHGEVSLKQSLGFKPCSDAATSLTRVVTSESGSACWGLSVAGCWVFGGGLGQGRVYRKGKCSAGSFGYQWKGCVCAMPDNGVAFLYLPPLIHPQRKDNVKETCSRNISREGQPTTQLLLSLEKKYYKKSTDTWCRLIKLQLWRNK